MLQKFEDLVVWKKSHKLALMIYKLTKNFPADEKYRLISQMRRASISFPANIVEGFKKNGKKDKINFYNISQASLDELHYYIIFSKDLGYLSDTKLIVQDINEIGKMLTGLIKSTRGVDD